LLKVVILLFCMLVVSATKSFINHWHPECSLIHFFWFALI